MGRAYSRRLVRLVQIRQPDGAGGYGSSWIEAGALWADVVARTGGLRVTELGDEPRLRLKITTPGVPQGHASRPAPGDRLRDGTRLYEIEAVHEADPLGRALTLFASEITEGNAP